MILLFYYLLGYISFSAFTFFWMRYFLKIETPKFFLGSFFSNLVFINLINIGFWLTMFFTDNSFLGILTGFIFILLVSLSIRAFNQIKSVSIWEKKSDSSWINYLILFYVMLLGSIILSFQLHSPSFAWDSLSIWIPRMETVATGSFVKSLEIGFSSYPPFWIFTGSYVALFGSNFLFLFPAILIVHLTLAIYDYLCTQSSTKVCLVIYAVLLPTIYNYFFVTSAFALYSNFWVAILLGWCYLLEKELKFFQVFFGLIILLISAVLSRPDTIVFATIWFIVFTLTTYKKNTKMFLFGGLTIFSFWVSWKLYMQKFSVNENLLSMIQIGFWQLVNHNELILNKLLQEIRFYFAESWPVKTLWFFNIYFLISLVSSLNRKWSVIITICLVYVFFQYLFVPLKESTTMEWYLSTGFVRMMSPFIVWIALDLILKTSGLLSSEIVSKRSYKNIL